MATMEMVYLYGFVSPATPVPPDDFEGIHGRPVELLDLDGYAAAVSRVPGAAFAESSLEEKLQDLDWVASQGARHERVVTWFVDHGQILPVRLLSLYSSLEALASEARASRSRIVGELERLAGLREWNLKVSYDADRLESNLGEVSDEIAALDREIESASAGRRYLLQKQRSDRARSAVSDEARRLAHELLEEADDLARESTTLPLARDGDSLPVVLNAALLVPRDHEEDLRERIARRVEALEEFGVDVEFSGPWAPYRFVRRDDEAA